MPKKETKTMSSRASGSQLIGRKKEREQLEKAFRLGRNILIEGPVGVGKTFLVQRTLEELDKGFLRVDGDTRYSEQKMTGWFDPPLVLKKGYVTAAFFAGPLVQAMKEGIPLFVNELNRMPESVQNILLPAMDERRIELPRLGTVRAKPGFFVIATQNPREFTATHSLSEALLDRFEMVRLDYQSREEEITILKGFSSISKLGDKLVTRAVDLVRSTRSHAHIKRGASLRAAIAVCELVAGGMEFEASVMMALPSRIELVSTDVSVTELLEKLLSSEELPFDRQKKKTLNV